MKKAVNRMGCYNKILSKSPKRLDPEEIPALLSELRSGDKSAKEKMINNYIRLAAAIAMRWAVKAPEKIEDLLAQAEYILVETVERVARGESLLTHDNIDAYVAKCINGQLFNYLKTDYLVRPPLDSSWIKALSKNDPEQLSSMFGTFQYVDDPVGERSKDHEIVITSEYAPSRAIRENIRRFNKAQFELTIKELLHNDLFTRREQTIISLRLKGFTDDEIGSYLGLTKMRVNQIRKGLYDRVKKILDGLV